MSNNIKEGNLVEGKDIYGNNISGSVENILKVFSMAQVRFSEDRLGVTTCSISSLIKIEEK